MSKVKLELQTKSDNDLEAFAKNHVKALVGNTNFPSPQPTPSDFEKVLTAYSAILLDVSTAETALQTLRSNRDERRADLEKELNGRGSYVDLEAKGNEQKILSAGFQVQLAATPTTSLPAPGGIKAVMGAGEGTIDVGCSPVPKARTYVTEMREHPETALPGPWSQVKLSSRSATEITGLTSGKRYAFRIRVVGPNDIQSPWSAEISCMAP